MSLTIRFLTGQRGHPPVILTAGTDYHLGRDSSCEISLPANNVSRRHARLVWNEDDLIVEDQRSRNGTYVNGVRVDRAVLGAGDVIVVGAFALRVDHTQPGDQERSGSRHVVVDGDFMAHTETKGTDTSFSGLEATSNGPELVRCVESIRRILSEHTGRMVQESLNVVFEILPVTRCALFVVGADEELHQVLTITDSAERVANLSRSFARRVLEAGAPILITDALTLDPDEWGTTVIDQHVRSVIGAPVLKRNRVFGVLLADNLHEPDVLDDMHKQILGFVGRALEIVFHEESLLKLKAMTGLLSICCVCRKIRDDDGEWKLPEEYFGLRTDLLFSHGFCPHCEQEYAAQQLAEDSE